MRGGGARAANGARTGLDLLPPAMLNMGPMAAPPPIEVTVTFGPTSSILLRRAVGEATRHASTCAEIAPGVWRASFALGGDPGPYARAHRLIQLTGSWKATEVEVGGSPESIIPVLSMTECARGWLRRTGACRASFPTGPWPKCELCPLYDAGWAAESYTAAPFFAGGSIPGPPVPDYPPEN